MMPVCWPALATLSVRSPDNEMKLSGAFALAAAVLAGCSQLQPYATYPRAAGAGEVDAGPRVEVAGQHPGLQLGGDVAAGVLQQVGEVPGGVAAHGVLEVQQADAGGTLALRQPALAIPSSIEAAPIRRSRNHPNAAV